MKKKTSKKTDKKADDFNYEEYVKACKKEQRNVMISNRDLGHATILISNIVETAEEKICLLTRCCEDSFYTKPEIQSQFLSFINKENGSGKIEIIFEAGEKKTTKCKEFIKSLEKEYKKFTETPSLFLYQLKDNSYITGTDKDEGEDYRVHYIVVDNNKAFRYEKHSLEGETEDSDDSTIEAKANFGNQRISESLQNSFEGLKKCSSTISISQCTG